MDAVARQPQHAFLGAPVSGHQYLVVGSGCRRHYQHGSVYYAPAAGLHVMYGAIHVKWEQLGEVSSVLGYPIAGEVATADGTGRSRRFQYGTVYWHPSTGAYEVHGAIRDRYDGLGRTAGLLGYPVSDETETPDGAGRYNHFQHGSIYWHPNTGAYEVHGAIRSLWSGLAWEQGPLGYPITDELPAPGGMRYSVFENDAVFWSPGTGPFVVSGPMYDGRVIDLDQVVPLSGNSPYAIEGFIQQDPRLSTLARTVGRTAAGEMQLGMCGLAAKARYGAEPDAKWCSEFAAAVYRWSGFYVPPIVTTKQLVDWFRALGRWVGHAQIARGSAQVGDYVALDTNSTDGKKKNHSAIIIGIAYDQRHVLTAEGNVGDCARMKVRPWFDAQGALNPQVYGLGRL